MHLTIIYIRNEKGELLKEVKTQMAFAPAEKTNIYHDKMKAIVTSVIIDVSPKNPVIIVTALIK